MKRPFAFISIPVLIGIVFYYFIDISLGFSLFLMVLSTLINLVLYKKNINYEIGLLVMFFILGIFISSYKIHSSVLLDHTGELLKLEGTIEEIKYTDSDKVKALVSIKSIKGENVDKSISEKIVLTVIGHNKLNTYDKISFNAQLRQPDSNTNPKLYNYKLNLLSNGIFTTATIRESSILGIRRDNLNFLSRLKKEVVETIEEVYDKYLSKDNSSLMKSIVLGDYSYLEEEEVNEFRELGIAHVIAVSGLHIGLISALIIGILSYMGIDRKINVVVTLSIIWIYGFIIGMPASVFRANITFSLLFISHVLAKPYDSINTLFFSIMILILVNPFWCFNLGFQLSYITTFFIIYLTPRIRKVLRDKGSLSGTLAAQIGILPLIAYYFNSLPIMSIVANIVLVPLFTLSLVLSIILLIISYINFHVSNSIGVIINAILNFESIIAKILYSFPVLSIKVYSPSIAEILMYYIIIFLIINRNSLRKLHKGIVKTIIFSLIFFILINLVYVNFSTSLSLDFIDVGQGDSILLRAKGGNYLIDTGGNTFGDYDIGKNIVLPYLTKQGVFKLNGVFISHFHEDHVKSLPYLMDNIEIEKIYIGYTKRGNQLYDDMVSKAYENDIPIYLLKRGDKLKLGRDTYIFVLGPNRELLEGTKQEDNELSLCLLLKHFNQEVLFTGDVEEKGEKNLIHTLKKDVDFIKVPHHGSKTSSTEKFLEKFNPKAGFISVGRNNIYGHPHEDVLRRYDILGIDVYRTDESGLLNLLLDEDYYRIETYLKNKRSVYFILENYGIYISISIIYLIILNLMIKYFLYAIKELERIEP